MAENNSKAKGFGPFILAVPWLWHLALAIAAHLVLHTLAARELPLPDQSPEETALYTHRLLWKTVATLLQFVLPAAFSLAVVFSFRRGREKERKINR